MSTHLTLGDVSEALRAPFPPGIEQYRVGPTWEKNGERWGRPLAYIDARAVFQRLDQAVGPDGWESQLERLAPGVYLCRLTVLGITRSDVGMAGEHESETDKSAASDAVKRAAVQFGVASYLYRRELPPVKLERRGKDWALPKGWRPSTLAGEPAPAPANTVLFPDAKSGTATKRQVAKIASEMERAGWGEEDGRAYIQRCFGKRSRMELTAAEASNFIDALVALPSAGQAL